MNLAGLYSWTAVAPALVVLAAALLVVVADLFAPPGSRLLPWLSAAGLIGAMVTAASRWGVREEAFSGAWQSSDFSLFFTVLFCVAALVTLVLSGAHEERRGRFPGEYYGLLLLSVVGMITMASATDLITLIIGLETMSLCAYVMVGLNRGDPRTAEGALKYFLLGAFASAFLLYGTALLYGASGTVQMVGLSEHLAAQPEGPGLLFTGGATFLLVGLGFKIASVPFHMWAPDAYQAAPTPFTGFMATAVKAAGFAAVVRIFGALLASPTPLLADLLWWLAVLSMVVGNLAAVMQANLKRMLAYSSIAHAGYLLVAVTASTPAQSLNGGTGALFYLAGYALMTLGAFAVLVVVGGGADRRETLQDLSGLATRRPGLALAMTLFMVSLSGIPGTVGFVGKLQVFGAAVESGYVALAVIGVLTSVVGVFYYLRVVVHMYMKPAEKSFTPFARPLAARLTVALLAAAVLWSGLLPQGLLALARRAFASILG